jgi:hypothetical protein
MNAAQLNPGLRILDRYRIGEDFEAIHTGNQDILRTSGFELGG